MELPTPPTGFARATGVVEGRRKCLDCQRIYPVTSRATANEGQPCPHCSSTKTQAVSNPQE